MMVMRGECGEKKELRADGMEGLGVLCGVCEG